MGLNEILNGQLTQKSETLDKSSSMTIYSLATKFNWGKHLYQLLCFVVQTNIRFYLRQCSSKINVFTAKLHPLKINSEAEEGRQQCQATVEGGSCHSEAAGGGSRRRLIRKYQTNFNCCPGNASGQAHKIKAKKVFSFADFWFFFFLFSTVNEKGFNV